MPIPEDLANETHGLREAQRRAWPAFDQTVEQLSQVQVQVFDFDGFSVKSQFNPARMAWMCARVDDEAVRARKCFLCDANRPPEQMTLDVGGGFKLMCNPFPILPEHFTIIHEQHRPQRILDGIETMLRIVPAMSERYTVFYNGPQCGASAPDHLHLQAGTRGFMPIDADYDRIKRPIWERGDVSVFETEQYLRRFIGIESRNPEALLGEFIAFHNHARPLQPQAVEPMMNIIASFADGTWRLVIFPRSRHRPSVYYAEDDSRLMLSPGAVDMAGVVVVPQPADFARVAKQHIAEMYEEVTIPSAHFSKMKHW